MNKSVLQYERAASAQRDLFDNQIRIEDQIIEQKSEPNHPGSLKERVTLNRRYHAAVKRRTAVQMAYFDHLNAGKGTKNRRVFQALNILCVELGQKLTGPTTRSLTDTFNSKL